MKATITQIESVVTPSGNSGHVAVPKAWIGKEAIVTLKERGIDELKVVEDLSEIRFLDSYFNHLNRRTIDIAFSYHPALDVN